MVCCDATGRVFLWLFALIIALGVLHAFVLLPVLLVAVAPPTCGMHSEDDDGTPGIEMSDHPEGAAAVGGPQGAEERLAPAGQI